MPDNADFKSTEKWLLLWALQLYARLAAPSPLQQMMPKPAPLTRTQRWRRNIRWNIAAARLRVGSWIAGVDLEENGTENHTMSKPLNENQLTEAQVEHLQGVRMFEGMNPDQFRYLVRRVEFEHRIGDSMELEEAGIVRLKGGTQPDISEGAPDDYMEPEWWEGSAVSNWHNYISDEVHRIWTDFTPGQRAALARQAVDQASKEEWD